jgi:Uma2 family endonuclease
MMTAEATIETRLITADELAAMGDVGPCELVEGRIVPMTPTGDEHSEYEITLGALLWNYVRQHQLGKIYGGEAGIILRRDPDTVRGADIAFVARERVQPRTGKFLAVVPDLIVEIASPGDSMTEITEKLGEYFMAGVRLVWVVLPKTRQVYAYRSLADVRIFSMGDTLPGDDVLPGLALPVAEIFAE